ncbi:MAG: DUF1801 domain-containing protein, partial [Thermoplasmata archaeon]|nr:DUF1801 domain-containing protein [Thermoplasmata archaeon]
MTAKKFERKGRQKPAGGFTDEERAAMKERVRELRAPRKSGKSNGDADVRAKIAKMDASDRIMAERFHKIMRVNAPNLTPRTWYGMPAYSKDDQVVCFFRNAGKFKTRYATLGFSDESKLDEGNMWPTDFALTKLT